jgi:hypothetical protein
LESDWTVAGREKTVNTKKVLTGKESHLRKQKAGVVVEIPGLCWRG